MSNESNLLQHLIDSCHAVIYPEDEHGRFVMVNRRAAELANLSKEALIGNTAYDLIPKEEADKVTEIDRKVAETGTPLNFKDTISLPSGQITLLDHKFAVALQGYPNAVGGIAIDITKN